MMEAPAWGSANTKAPALGVRPSIMCPGVGGSQIRACEMKKSRHKPTFWQRTPRESSEPQASESSIGPRSGKNGGFHA